MGAGISCASTVIPPQPGSSANTRRAAGKLDMGKRFACASNRLEDPGMTVEGPPVNY